MKLLIISGALCSLLVAAALACHTPKPAAAQPREREKSPTISPAMNPSPTENMVPAGKTDDFLAGLLRSQARRFGAILEKPGQYQVQIIYTRITRDAGNQPSFERFSYQNDPKHYFYPASVVKMPIAFLALQKINELRSKGVMIDRNTTMITETSGHAQTAVFNDPTAPDGRPTVAHYIKKIFLVSDNDAYNRLYEFLGQEYIHRNLQRMGMKQTEILHRLSLPMSETDNRHTNPVVFYDTAGTELYRQEAQFHNHKFSQRNDKRGNGYMAGDKLVQAPFDFSKKNRMPLEDMHQTLAAVLFPEQTAAAGRFQLTADDYRFLHQYMSQLPGESRFPEYPAPAYWDAYVKFNLFGSEKKPMPGNIRVFNKVGEAYGYLTDVSYIVDFDNQVEFMLSATIYVNKDGIFNDDKYEYETEGFPFFRNLGEVIYEYELKRPRKHRPDLSSFRMLYDK